MRDARTQMRLLREHRLGLRLTREGREQALDDDGARLTHGAWLGGSEELCGTAYGDAIGQREWAKACVGRRRQGRRRS